MIDEPDPKCSECGIELTALPGATRCIDFVKCARRKAAPFDPNPRALEPSTNGFIWCHECESVQPVGVQHHCVLEESLP